MSKTLRGLRGATTAAANTSQAILDATAELLRALQEANAFQPEDVESAIFTSSPDLTAEYPARAARLLGWTDVPLLGTAEVAVPDGLPRCIRQRRDVANCIDLTDRALLGNLQFKNDHTFADGVYWIRSI